MKNNIAFHVVSTRKKYQWDVLIYLEDVILTYAWKRKAPRFQLNCDQSDFFFFAGRQRQFLTCFQTTFGAFR